MLQVPEVTGRRFEAAMAAAEVAVQERWYYRKWLRYYLDFCGKYGRPPAEEASLGPFLEKLASKNQSAAQRRQAAQAVRRYIGMLRTASQAAGREDGGGMQSPPPRARPTGLPVRPNPGAATRGAGPAGPEAPDRRESLGVRDGPPPHSWPRADAGPAARPSSHPPWAPGQDGCLAPQPRIPPPQGATGASWVQELDALRNAIRLRNYSPRTSETYVHWTRKFQTYTRSKPPNQLATEDVKSFLTDLAVRAVGCGDDRNRIDQVILPPLYRKHQRQFPNSLDIFRVVHSYESWNAANL